MLLTAYRTAKAPLMIRPASMRRSWMDRTSHRQTYRCLPLTIANQHGWELLCPAAFDAMWTGGHSTKSITIITQGQSEEPPVENHFGDGVLTFYPGYLFRTDRPHAMYVTGPPNIRKDGIVPLTGIVETDWLPFSFTMNWIFTRPGVLVRFEKDEPICQFFPVVLDLVESVSPEIRDIAAEPSTKERFLEWTALRKAFIKDLNVPGTLASKQGWQRFYSKGTLPTGDSIARNHKTRLNVASFTERFDSEAAANDPTETKAGLTADVD